MKAQIGEALAMVLAASVNVMQTTSLKSNASHYFGSSGARNHVLLHWNSQKPIVVWSRLRDRRAYVFTCANDITTRQAMLLCEPSVKRTHSSESAALRKQVFTQGRIRAGCTILVA